MYQPASYLKAGENPYLLYLETCVEDRRNCLYNANPSNSPNYPITAFALLVPFTFLDIEDAKSLWLVVNLTAIGLILWCLWALFYRQGLLFLLTIFALVFVSSSPLRIGLGNGQQSFVAFALFLLSLRVADRRPGLGGVLLGLSFLKYTLTIPLALIFIYRRNWKVLLLAGATQLFLLCLCALWLETPPWALIQQQLSVAADSLGPGWADIGSLVAKAGFLEGLPNSFVPAILISAATAVFLLRPGQEVKRTLALLSLLTLIVVYHLIYDYIILAILLFYLAWAETWRRPLEFALHLGAIVYFFHGFRLIEAAVNQGLLPVMLEDIAEVSGITLFYLSAVVLIARAGGFGERPERRSTAGIPPE